MNTTTTKDVADDVVISSYEEKDDDEENDRRLGIVDSDILDDDDIDIDDDNTNNEEEDEEMKNNSKSNKKEEEARLVSVGAEQRAVWHLRLLTSFVLVGVAIAVCLVVGLQQTHNERDNFEAAFHRMGGQFISTFENNVLDRVGIVESFGMKLTSTVAAAREANAAAKEEEAANATTVNPNNDSITTTSMSTEDDYSWWPFVTPPDFENLARKTGELAELTFMFLVPRVEDDQKQAWQAYARENQGWVEQGLIAQGHPEPDNVRSISPVMFTINDEGKPTPLNTSWTGPYFPFWTQWPAAIQTLTNFDPYHNSDNGQLSIDAIYETKQPSFPESYHFWGQTPEEQQEHFVFRQIRLVYPDYEGDPYYAGYYPVFDRLQTAAERNGEVKDDRQIVAALNGAIIWRTYFESILPEGTSNIIVILANRCNQTFTYEVGGNHARLVDPGDFHDTKYDYLEKSTDMNTILGVKEETFNLHEGNCAYSIRVYPSKEFEESHYTNGPLTIVLILAGVFLFTCTVFLLYDYMVERRQKAVMKSALQSGRLVSSLFPEDVRKRLYEEEDAKKKASEQRRGWEQQEQALDNRGGDGIEQRPPSNTTAQAIATLYPETTIFFADLAGFTKWSSTRTPVEVFDLLEKIYGQFDSFAKKYKVFKVETIGDCYVAVTGLPHAQPDHAIRMCKFARVCMSKFHILMAEAAETMGEDTTTLEMRVGLHSGPVTGGVLRGEKARFQLFGDSVNVASRMESNGIKGRIHCSEATAEVLRKGGRGPWLTPREDKIIAKGKGEMQTYWIQICGVAATSNAGSTVMSSQRVSSNPELP